MTHLLKTQTVQPEHIQSLFQLFKYLVVTLCLHVTLSLRSYQNDQIKLIKVKWANLP